MPPPNLCLFGFLIEKKNQKARCTYSMKALSPWKYKVAKVDHFQILIVGILEKDMTTASL